MNARRTRRALLLVAVTAMSFVGSRGAQAQGAITGRVTDASTNAPIASAGVTIIGTTIATQTNEQGQYTIRGIRPGPVEVRALRVGYSEQRATVTVSAGQTA